MRSFAVEVTLAPVLEHAAENVRQERILLPLLVLRALLRQLLGEVRGLLLVDRVHGPDLLLDGDELLGGERLHAELLPGGVLPLEGVPVVGGVVEPHLGHVGGALVRVREQRRRRRRRRRSGGIPDRGGGARSSELDESRRRRRGGGSEEDRHALGIEAPPRVLLPRPPGHVRERAEDAVGRTDGLVVYEEVRDPVIGDEAGLPVEVVLGDPVDVQRVPRAAVYHLGHELDVPAHAACFEFSPRGRGGEGRGGE